jgi:hypothetical protein
MSQIQALDRIAPCLPVPPTTPARMAHSAIAQHYRRHPHQVFVRFPRLIDATVPAGLDLQLTCDNYATYKTPAVKNWLLRHPRFHLHFAPASSRWINPKSFVWTKTADQILDTLAACSQANQRLRALERGETASGA